MDLHGLEEGRLNYFLVLQIPSKLFEPPNISGAWSCRGQPHDFGVPDTLILSRNLSVRRNQSAASFSPETLPMASKKERHQRTGI